jgi:hypothetical protein
MVTVTVPTIATASSVATLRGEYVTGLTQAYGSGRKYAAELLAFFRAEGFGEEWITMAHDEKGAAGDSMRAERDALYSALKSAGHSNPSVKWKQIKRYAEDLIAAEKPAAEGEGEGEGEGESTGGAKHTRSLQLRLIEELTTLYKALKRDDKVLTDAQRTVFTHVAASLAALGVDIATV